MKSEVNGTKPEVNGTKSEVNGMRSEGWPIEGPRSEADHHMGEDRTGDVLDTPIEREYMPVPFVPEAPVVSERVLELERSFEGELVLIESQMVNRVPLGTWA